MATQIRGSDQIKQYSITLDRLIQDFLQGSNWNITDGNNNATITGLGNPVNPRDAVTKEYVDNLIAGRKYKDPVRVFADSNIDITNPPSTIDGVTLNTGDRIAAFYQTDPTQDGIWIYNGSGNPLTRAVDFDTGMSVANATFTVQEGTQYENSRWLVTNDPGSDVVGTDDLHLFQESGPGSITASNGLHLDGNDIKLGGTLVENTTIDLNTYNFSISSNNSGDISFHSENSFGNQSANLQIQENRISIDVNENPTQIVLDFTTTSFELGARDINMGTHKRIFADATMGGGIRIIDTIDSQGLVYEQDYHTSWVNGNPRSIVDKAYIDKYDDIYVRVRATGNIDIANPPSSIDSVALSNGDLILLDQQSTATEDGIYVYNGSGNALTRAPYFETGLSLKGKRIYVTEGSTQGQTLFAVSNTDNAVLGTDDINVVVLGGSASEITADNGLHKSGNIIRLGGNLIENTSIELDDYFLQVTANGGSLLRLWQNADSTTGFNLHTHSNNTSSGGIEIIDYSEDNGANAKGILVKTDRNGGNIAGNITIESQNELSIISTNGLTIQNDGNDLIITNNDDTFIEGNDLAFRPNNDIHIRNKSNNNLFEPQVNGLRLFNYSSDPTLAGDYYGSLIFNTATDTPRIYVQNDGSGNPGWVDLITSANAIAGADNGLHVNAADNKVYLGGTLLEDTTIQKEGYELEFDSNDGLGNTSIFRIGVNHLYWEGHSPEGEDSYVYVTPGYIHVDNEIIYFRKGSDRSTPPTVNFGQSERMTLTPDFVWMDYRTTKRGFRYGADYSENNLGSNYSERWIPDVAFVDYRAKTAVVRVYADSNIDISNPPSDIDGVTLSAGDLIALFNQTTTTEDGIYIYNGSGNALTRSPYFPSGFNLLGYLISVTEGNNNGNNLYMISNNTSAVLGTDDIETQLIGGASAQVTAENGLHKTGNAIRLGGTLLEDTLINGGTYGLTISGRQIDFSASQQFTVDVGSTFDVAPNKIDFEVASGNDDNYVEIMPTVFRTTLDDGNTIIGFEISQANSFLINDSINEKGMYYNADYSANNTGANDNPRWIPDKGYVDSQISSATNRVFNAEPTFTAGSNVATLNLSGGTIEKVALYLNGERLKEGDDFTITDTAAGEFTFSSITLQADDIIIVDYNYS